MINRLFNLVSLGMFCSITLVLLGNIPHARAEDQQVKALIAVDDAWSNAAVAKNVDAVASFYAEDGIAYPPNEPVAVGRAAARKMWAAYFADRSFQISWKTTKAGIANSTGWTAGTYEASFKGPDGKTVVENGKYLTVWRRENGVWRAVHDMWNTNAK
jgi:ketosteroid isomerase-like protein